MEPPKGGEQQKGEKGSTGEMPASSPASQTPETGPIDTLQQQTQRGVGQKLGGEGEGEGMEKFATENNEAWVPPVFTPQAKQEIIDHLILPLTPRIGHYVKILMETGKIPDVHVEIIDNEDHRIVRLPISTIIAMKIARDLGMALLGESPSYTIGIEEVKILVEELHKQKPPLGIEEPTFGYAISALLLAAKRQGKLYPGK